MDLLLCLELNQRSIKSRRAKAAQRREQVKVLKEQGRSGREIAEQLQIKLRTVYQDFAILKREAETNNGQD